MALDAVAAKKPVVDWLAIEGEYRAGKKPVNALAKEHGITEGTIRARAKKNGWARDPAGQQREKVKAHFSGITNGVTNDVLRKIDAATERAIDFEELALTNAELALARINAAMQSDGDMDSADLKRLSEANKINLEVGRTIFTLNDPDRRDGVGYDELPFPD